MLTRLSRLAVITAMLALFICPLGLACAATGEMQPGALKPGMQIAKAASVGVSQPLRSITPLKVDLNAPSAVRSMQDRRLVIPKTLKAGGGIDESIVQDSPIGMSIPAYIANFEGVHNINGVYPPDTQGDIGIDPATGKKYYIQWVNLSFQIWDVSTPATPTSVYGPAAGNTLWSGFGGICESNNDGDPITMFDHLANRWVMAQFALSNPNNYHECIAVSTSADPTGSWYRYDFKISSTKMNDYPHLGVWPDGYYMSINQFLGGSAWAGAGAVVFDRTAMLSGAAASMIYFDIGTVTLNYGGMLPSDLDGPAPATETPNYFMEWDDSSWIPGDTVDTLRVWEFHVDWATPANSTFGLNPSYDPNLKITTADMDPNLCGTGSNKCISQPGTSVKLDPISDRLMHRLQFRDFGSYQTIVGNHTVDATSADKAGIHWFELRDTGTGFTMHQQGVYAPDTDSRWMGSIAMDDSGDMALGYSVSSSVTYPSIRYTGRLAADPVGTLPQGEASIIAGSGSQTGSAARWGDYSAMTIDPEDGCTFWYTQEYIATTGGASWQTRIGSFKFPSCTSTATGMLSGTVTDSGSAPIDGATVEATGGYATVTDAAGLYSLPLVAGTYTVTASKYGYSTGSASSVVVTPPGTTTQNFMLTAAPVRTISGTVTDTTTGWPLYASITIAGYPGGPVYTNPVTGTYSVNIADGSYTFTVSASGYTKTIAPVVVSGTATHNFDLVTDTSDCSAPGYASGSGFSENFDISVTPPALPAGWAQVGTLGTTGNWATNTATVHPSGGGTHSSPNLIYFNSYTATSGNNTRLYRTSGVDLTGASSASLSFWMYHDTGSGSANDSIQVQVSTNGGSSWNNVGSPVYRYSTTAQWTQHTIDLTAYTGSGNTDVRVAFNGISAWGNDIHIDDVKIPCSTLAGAGLAAGTVSDQNTGLPLAGVTVKSGSSSAVSDSSGVYVLSSPAGTHDVTAIAPWGYDNVTASVSFGSGTTTGQDFYLSAGLLTANPTSLTFDVTTVATTASKPLGLNNSGGLKATYEFFAIPGSFAGYGPTGPFAENTRHFGPPHLNDTDASQIRVDLTPRDITLLSAGDVSASWNTGLTYSWGTGFNTDDTDLWVGNSGIGGGDDLDYRFTTAGVNTGDTIDTTPWRSVWGADMTYNPFTNKLWQVNVGGDDCIYEMDPATRTSTGRKICPAFGTSERGLAFDPLTNTYYSGSWNDGIINHFAPDGTILDSKDVGLNISSLAFNPSTGHLFVMTNAATTSDPTLYDVYMLDTKAAYTILGGFNLMDGATTKAFGDNQQAGLEIDCSGKLWATNQVTQKVFVADSSETGVCDWQASWLGATPPMGSTAAGGYTPLTVNVNAAVLGVGMHKAYLRVANDTPYNDIIVPITLNVTATTTTTVPPCVDNDADGYFVGEGCTPEDCNDNDAFYNEVCPNCEVKIIPRALGWFLGEKEKTRHLLVIGKKGTEFDKNTEVRWESGDIAVVNKRVFFKRFMFMKVSIDGAALGKGAYRALIGTCSATLNLVK